MTKKGVNKSPKRSSSAPPLQNKTADGDWQEKAKRKEGLRGVGLWVFLGVILISHSYFLYLLKDEYEKNPFGHIPKNFVSMSAPLLVGSVIVEALYTKQVRLNDGLNSINTGALSELGKKVASTLTSFSPYVYIYQNYAVTDYFAQPSTWTWWLMFVLVDFGYYWLHRTGHTVRALWACHAVHHSSEEYNLTTALRQSTFHTLASWLYYLPLAFFFPPLLYFYHLQFNLLYQFWIHTEVVGHLGPLEWIFNTPSQHRVHHGRNAYCIDKNYGGTLCVFDRLFGTFAEERSDEPVVYGLTHSLNTMNPITANTHLWSDIWRLIKAEPTWLGKWRVLYYGPGWMPGTPDESHQYAIPTIAAANLQKYDPKIPPGHQYYLLLHVLFYLVCHLIIMAAAKATHIWIMSAYLATFSFSFGTLLDRKSWAPYVESFRLLLGVLCLWSAEYHVAFQIANALLALFSLIFVWSRFRHIVQPLQPAEIGLAGSQ